ncbi:MAG: glucosaminidase domain-containing protein [Sulfurimonas sp.]|uniref:glucosaminidase domain-containing protein n=1 Tax=Sulfurimonas sp. TaxID=2022749 RepID=UPI0025F4D3A6|nr:glucosaminidase domain-containing protein [Sulfurimonas sp.]MCK9455529.1 glucosaminidase domain-containing protein [Sulfurimonas sp.]
MKFLSDNMLYIYVTSLILSSLYDTIFIKKETKPNIMVLHESQEIPQNSALSASDRKREFSNLVIPAVDRVYAELEEQYNEISENLTNRVYQKKILQLKKMYKVESDEELLMALKPHPKSIAIAQAAMESAWAESRFFKEANNLYGMWSVNKKGPRIAASEQRGKRVIWLKKYPSIEDSIRDYYKTLARSKAYRDFRELKMQTDDPYLLVEKLERYSEIGEKYGEDLTKIIRYNKLYIYDE